MSTSPEESPINRPSPADASSSTDNAASKTENSDSTDPHEAVRQAHTRAQNAVVASQKSEGLA